MIRHIVLIKFKPEITEDRVKELFEELASVQSQLPGMRAISSGLSESPEKMERGFMHGFVADFADWDALEAYQDNADHQTLGAKLTEAAVGGKDGILCFDYEFEA
ncbi:Dabb family protein [Cognatishimia activa]|uniref:Dabb family protein n=1 Tax=Cognatishimia activa TaxID=1715691 RepID=UPI00222F0D0A|nr:Dabb family protein [Cognatishimia activa]UZD91255.1 Dabb family protein [Cognatishimia activa]